MAAIKYRGRSYWVYRQLIEEYLPESERGIVTPPISLQTLDEYDAEQYLQYEKRRLTNLCGQFCVVRCANLAGYPDSVLQFLEKWSVKDPKYYRIIVPPNRPTGVDALQSMCSVYGLENAPLEKGLFDPVLKRAIYSPGRIQAKLADGWRLIAGTVIGLDGKLIATGTIGHWVLLEDIRPVRNGDGFVKIYNSYPNRMQEYSYNEFMASMRRMGMNGLWVKVGKNGAAEK